MATTETQHLFPASDKFPVLPSKRNPVHWSSEISMSEWTRCTDDKRRNWKVRITLWNRTFNRQAVVLRKFCLKFLGAFHVQKSACACYGICMCVCVCAYACAYSYVYVCVQVEELFNTPGAHLVLSASKQKDGKSLIAMETLPVSTFLNQNVKAKSKATVLSSSWSWQSLFTF